MDEQLEWPRRLNYNGANDALRARIFIAARPMALWFNGHEWATERSAEIMRYSGPGRYSVHALRASIRATDPDDTLSGRDIGAMVQAIADLTYARAQPDWPRQPAEPSAGLLEGITISFGRLP